MRAAVLRLLCLAVAGAFTGSAFRTHVRHTQPLRKANFVRRSNAVALEVASEVALKPNPALTPLKPNPSLTPLEVVEELLRAMSKAGIRGRKKNIKEAFEYLSPTIIARNQMDVAKFKTILETAMFEGLLGCEKWEVMKTRASDDSNLAVMLKIWPKAMPVGCNCPRCQKSELTALSKMPQYFKWDLCRCATEPYADCWMLNQMSPQRPQRMM